MTDNAEPHHDQALCLETVPDVLSCTHENAGMVLYNQAPRLDKRLTIVTALEEAAAAAASHSRNGYPAVKLSESGKSVYECR